MPNYLNKTLVYDKQLNDCYIVYHNGKFLDLSCISINSTAFPKANLGYSLRRKTCSFLVPVSHYLKPIETVPSNGVFNDNSHCIIKRNLGYSDFVLNLFLDK